MYNNEKEEDMTIKEFLHDHIGATITGVAFVISAGLTISSFLIPPVGIIDPSVLAAIGEIGIFTTLCRIPDIIREVNNGKSVEVRSGNMSVRVEDKE